MERASTEKTQREQARAIMRKLWAPTQATPSLEWEYTTTTNPVQQLEVEKHTRDTTGPEGRTHSFYQGEQSGNFLTGITSFFQFLRDSESEIQRRVNEMDKAGPPAFRFSSFSHEMQRLEDYTLPDRELVKLLNKLCKICTRYRVVPKSMNFPDCSKNFVEVECGGFANVSQSTYEGRQVAVKVVRMYITSDLDAILSVSLLPAT